MSEATRAERAINRPFARWTLKRSIPKVSTVRFRLHGRRMRDGREEIHA
jgi:hypothetical protein